MPSGLMKEPLQNLQAVPIQRHIVVLMMINGKTIYLMWVERLVFSVPQAGYFKQMVVTVDIRKEVQEAESRIRSYIRETPVEASHCLSDASGAEVNFKCENLQHTGSFKFRGAVNKLLSLTDDERMRGVVAASTGNHGMAVALAMKEVETGGVVFVPRGASETKVSAIETYGAEVRYHGDDCVEAEAFARHHADENGMTYVSPYNDPRIVGGQGTVGVELERQLNGIDAVFVALGGGGLITGIAGYIKPENLETKIIGCSPQNSPVMIESIRTGQIVEMESKPTLSDGTAGGIEADTITFDPCRKLLDDTVLVSEDEIASALRQFMEKHHMLIEGSAAVAIAAFLKQAEQWTGKRVVIVLCGANISLETLKGIL